MGLQVSKGRALRDSQMGDGRCPISARVRHWSVGVDRFPAKGSVRSLFVKCDPHRAHKKMRTDPIRSLAAGVDRFPAKGTVRSLFVKCDPHRAHKKCELTACLSGIPTGFCHKARGCAAEALPRVKSKDINNPEGVVPMARTGGMWCLGIVCIWDIPSGGTPLPHQRA